MSSQGPMCGNLHQHLSKNPQIKKHNSGHSNDLNSIRILNKNFSSSNFCETFLILKKIPFVFATISNANTCYKNGRTFASADGKSNGSNPNPPRITSNLNHTLKYLKLFKEYNKTKSAAQPTKYRKKKTVKSDEVVELEKDYFLEDLYFGDKESTILLVDGYNICGFWPKLKKAFAKGHLDIARDKLIGELVTFSGVRGVKVVVVFDAFLSGLPSSKEEFYNLEIIYTAMSDADSWIEREVRLLKEKGIKKIWVASSDTGLSYSASSTGAFIWTSSNLVSEINEARKELQEMIDDDVNKYSFKGKRLEHNLDKKTCNDLLDLRKELVMKNKYW